jgi:hypothetical protein
MGLMDKVKAQAEQAIAKGKEGMAQGQAKLDAMQAKKHGDALLRDLGAAYYAQHKGSGSAAAVETAMAKVAAHEAENGPVDTAATAPAEPGTPAAPGQPAPSYNIEDL